jgi:hypothetical protein
MRVALGALVFLAASAAWAGPKLEPVDLQKVFDRYNQAVSAGRLKEAMALRTKDVRKDLEPAMRSPDERAQTEAMLRAMVPRAYEVLGMDAGRDERSATLDIVGSFVPDDPEHPRRGETIRHELSLQFAKEGSWRLGVVTWGIDLDTIRRSDDEWPEPEDSYDFTREVALTGRILRVAFEPDYTLVVVRVVDEEQLAFLPSRAGLEKAEFDPAKLVPRRVIEVIGHPHGTNDLKLLATGAEVTDPR